MALVSKDAKATDIPDNLFVYGGCCGGPAVSSGLIPGLIEWGMWRSDNPTVNNIKQFNLPFRPSSTVVNSPQSTGQVTLEAGSSRIQTVDPSAFTFMLVNAVKDLSQQNRELKAALGEMNPKAKLCSSRAKPH